MKMITKKAIHERTLADLGLPLVASQAWLNGLFNANQSLLRLMAKKIVSKMDTLVSNPNHQNSSQL